jgi:hypothetical protein
MLTFKLEAGALGCSLAAVNLTKRDKRVFVHEPPKVDTEQISLLEIDRLT